MPPTPPRVSDCLEEPEGTYPDPPAAPATGSPILDQYIVELTAWNNQVLGIATTDRIRWRSERRCVQKMVEAGLVR